MLRISPLYTYLSRLLSRPCNHLVGRMLLVVVYSDERLQEGCGEIGGL